MPSHNIPENFKRKNTKNNRSRYVTTFPAVNDATD